MMDFVEVLTEYVDNNTVLHTLVMMELGDLYETACEACKTLAKKINDMTPAAAQPEQREEFARLVKGRKQESIEALFERADRTPPNVYGSGLADYFRYAINQVFCTIEWNLELGLLKRFLEKRFEDNQREHVFVSFNYDLALDRAVQIASDDQWQPRDGYGFEIPFYITPDSSAPEAGECFRLPRSDPRFRILKPHGSLNWLSPIAHRAARGTANAANDLIVSIDDGWRPQYWCSANTLNVRGTEEWPRDYGILIAPPSKDKTTAVVPQTLDAEAAAIGEADEIFVIGYSIPKTDHEQRDLIRKAVLSRSNPVDSLTIVNYKAGKEYFSETKSLFEPLCVQTFNSGFADFVGDGAAHVGPSLT